MTPLASGLVGDWVAAATAASADTTVLRFAADGTVERIRIPLSHVASRTPWGPFHVYADTGRRQLLCFSYRRGRAQPACRYFQIDTLIDSSGRIHRRLRLLDWVEERRGATEIWIERALC